MLIYPHFSKMLFLFLLCSCGCGHSLSLRVVDASSGKPLQGASAKRYSYIRDMFFGNHYEHIACGTSDEGGVLRIQSLSPHLMHSITIEKVGYSDAEILLGTDAPVTVELISPSVEGASNQGVSVPIAREIIVKLHPAGSLPSRE